MVVAVPSQAPEQSEDPSDVLGKLKKRTVRPHQAINRLTFGPRPGQVANVTSQGVDAFIEDQLARTSPDAAAESRLGAFKFFGKSRRGEIVAAVEAMHPRYIHQSAAVRMELTHSNILRAVYSENQLYEMMCQFWMDHFNIQLVDVGKFPLMISYQERAIRPNAMGTFRDLLKATAHAPAMMQYLDNHISNANSDEGVNENYGRELLELHTLGIHRDGSQVYNEADVYAASQAMSGWSVDYSRGDSWLEFKFAPFMHGGAPMSILNGAWTSGGATGKAVGDSLLDFLATHPSTAKHLAEKLCRRFVSDGQRNSLVESTAQVYLDNNTAIVPVLRHIFASRQFRRSSKSPNTKVRKPFEVMVAMLRASGADITGDPHSAQAETLAGHLGELNHRPWHWPTPDGYPDRGSSWLTTAGLVSRFNLAAVLAGGADGFTVKPARYNTGGDSIGAAIDALAQDVGLGTIDAQHQEAIAAGLGLAVSDPASRLTTELLIRMAGLLFAHPTFQIR